MRAGCPCTWARRRPACLAASALVATIAARPRWAIALQCSSSRLAEEAVRPLPLPWPAGQGHAIQGLTARVAQRRRISKVLQFVTIVPVQHGGDASNPITNKAVWANPDDPASGPCEVQVIMGHTLEKALGHDEAIKLMNSVRPGVLVRMDGRAQSRPPPKACPTQPDPGGGKPATKQQQQQQQPEPDHQDPVTERAAAPMYSVVAAAHTVLDVMCSSLAVVSPEGSQHVAPQSTPTAGLPEATQAPMGGTVGQHEPMVPVPQTAGGTAVAPVRQPAVTATGQRSKFYTHPLAKHALSLPRSSSSSPAASNSGGVSAKALVSTVHHVWQLRRHLRDLVEQHRRAKHILTAAPLPGTALASSKGGQHEAVVVAGSADVAPTGALPALGQGPQKKRQGTPPLLELLPPPVGLDCEWQPYRGSWQEATPVELLQVGTRKGAFLVDLPALLQPNGPSGTALHGAPQEVAGLLADLLLPVGQGGVGVTPLGFGFGCDMQRLRQSYGRLSAFRVLATSRSPAPGRQGSDDGQAHVDSCQQQGVLGGADGRTRAAEAALARARAPCPLPGNPLDMPIDPASGAAPLVPPPFSCVEVLALARVAGPLLNNCGQIGLSRLVAEVLGKPLSKSEQRSSWRQRPLSKSQAIYARNDVLCLVAMHDALLAPLLALGGTEAVASGASLLSAVEGGGGAEEEGPHSPGALGEAGSHAKHD